MPSGLEILLGEKHQRWILIVVALLVLLATASLCWRGIVLSDEGYLLLQALDLRDGKVLYRDMDAFVTPGIWLLLAGLFSVVEPSVLASRFLALLCLLSTIAVSYIIVSRLAGRIYALACVGGLLVFSVWAFPAWTFAFYSPFAVMFALWGLERLLAWSQSKKARDLFFVGLWLGLSISFKQNYGVYALVGAAAGFIALHREAGESWTGCVRRLGGASIPVGMGLALIGLPLVGYFATQGALPQLFDSLVVRPFAFAGLHDIAYPDPLKIFDSEFMQSMVNQLTYGAAPLYQTSALLGLPRLSSLAGNLNILLFWVPPMVLGAGLLLAFSPARSALRIDAKLFSVVAMSGLLFLGVFPRADFNHLINVYQPVVVAGAVVTHRILKRYPAPRKFFINFGLGCCAVSLALYTVIAGSWFVSMVRSMDHELDVPRGGILLNELTVHMLDFQIQRIQDSTAPGEAILTVPDIAMLNFLADRPIPGRYYNLYEHHINRDEGAGVVEGVEENGVRLAISRMSNFFSDRRGLREYAPQLATYLKTNFDITYVMSRDGFVYLERRETPKPTPNTINALADCEGLDPAIDGGKILESHVLFDALYLYPGTWGKRTAVEAHCRVTVPPNSELALRIGFQPPHSVEPGTWLMAEILALTGDRSEKLLARIFDVAPPGFMQWGSVPYPEFRVDLSHLADEEVTLVFRTTRSGNLNLGLFYLGGFAMAWEDPRLEPISGTPGASAPE
ncbi:MAG: hypothetical protein VX574_10225 [Myxococcota bacterium]|nr:hypothetical protein [Myxococcota bacterium]